MVLCPCGTLVAMLACIHFTLSSAIPVYFAELCASLCSYLQHQGDVLGPLGLTADAVKVPLSPRSQQAYQAINTEFDTLFAKLQPDTEQVQSAAPAVRHLHKWSCLAGAFAVSCAPGHMVDTALSVFHVPCRMLHRPLRNH